MSITKNNRRLKKISASRVAFLAALIVVGLASFGCSNTPTNSTSANETKNSVSTAAVNNTAVNNATPNANLPPKTTVSEKVPVSLSDAGEYGENTYDMAKAKNWTKAAEKLHELKQSQSQMANDGIKSAELDAAIAALDMDVAAKDETATLRDANQVTFIVADLTAKYNPPIPVEVTKLDYYGRELEIWSMAKDDAKLKSTAQNLRQTWNGVKPKVEAKGGAKQAQNFEMLVAKLDAAQNTNDYAKVAAPILDEVDNLEKVFEK